MAGQQPETYAERSADRSCGRSWHRSCFRRPCPSVRSVTPEPGPHGRIADHGSPKSRLDQRPRWSTRGYSCWRSVLYNRRLSLRWFGPGLEEGLRPPLGAWCANTRECLAMLPRPGNAGSNTFTDHKEVLAGAVRQVPAAAWEPGIGQDGAIEEDKDAVEITGLMSRAGNRPGGLRWIARRVKPSRRQAPNLTAYEKKAGWRYSITCTNIPDQGMPGIPGSHHPQFIDVAHREHAVVETGGVRAAKAMGLRNLPSKSWQVNARWVIAANIAADLAAWTRLLGCRDDEDLREADPDTLRYRIWHIPARLARHARERVLKISPDWPWREAFRSCWHRLCALPAPA
jgi:hypothetical protein